MRWSNPTSLRTWAREAGRAGIPPDWLRQHRWEWLIQRVAWAVIAAVLIAAASGLLGGGGLSYRTAVLGQVTVEYPRISRNLADERYRFEIVDAADPVVLELPHSLAREVVEIIPMPGRQMIGGDAVRYEFPRATGQRMARVELRTTTASRGKRTLICRAGPTEIALRQLVLP